MLLNCQCKAIFECATRLISTSSTRGNVRSFTLLSNRRRRGLICSVLRGFSQLIAPRATFPTFNLDRSYDWSVCANGGVGRPRTTRACFGKGSGQLSSLDCPETRCAKRGVVVQKSPVRISGSALARSRRWTRRPHLCQRAGLEFAQHRVPGPRDFWDTTLGVAHQIRDCWQELTLDEGPEVEQLGSF